MNSPETSASSSYGFTIPILLIVWRRPHAISRVINAIRIVQPSLVFVACDGASQERPGELDMVIQTRKVIDQQIDWPCRIERLYSDVNQGCRLGPIRAITWFFDHVEEGIILEDDCIPHPDFLGFCKTLLARYRHDKRVWCISGSNFQHGKWRGEVNYYFSRYNHCWGWASWRRCWNHYDASLIQWPTLRDSGLMKALFDDPAERRYWYQIWQLTFDLADSVTWWDYQWTFTCLVNGGLTVIPNRNLVRNVGFGEDATHTFGRGIDTSVDLGIDPTIEPTFFFRNSIADRFTFDYVYRGMWYRLPWFFLRYLRSALGNAIRRIR